MQASKTSTPRSPRDGPGSSLRVGVAFPGDPADATTWSGTPLGLMDGLAQAGIHPVPINVEPRPALDFVTKNAVALLHVHRARRRGLVPTLRFARAIARASPELAMLRSWVGNRALERSRPLDGLVQIGTGYSFDTTTPIAVFCDITIVQAIELGYPEWRALSTRDIDSRLERQRRGYTAAIACCATTRWAGESIVRDYGVPPERVVAVGVGRNHDVERRDRDWSRPRFIWIGTDWYGKNGEGVLRAFERLHRERPDARLDLVGVHPRVSLEGVTGHGQLHLDNVEHRLRMSQLLQQATCFVLPSRYEAAAIAYVEAGAAGLPCIGTAVGGARELIGSAGRIVDPADDAALFEAMLELSTPEVAKKLGALAVERAPLFTWRAVAERVVRALRLPHPDIDSFATFL